MAKGKGLIYWKAIVLVIFTGSVGSFGIKIAAFTTDLKASFAIIEEY